MKMKKDVCKLAVEEYGVTDEFNKAGYIMPDGKMLNFSHGCEDDLPQRCIEHRDIDRLVYDEIPAGHEHWSFHEGITKFQKECGAIRFSKQGFNAPYLYVDILKKPTEKQLTTLRRAIKGSTAAFLERKDEHNNTRCYTELYQPLQYEVDKFIKKCYER